jgi:hypothetical protein
MLLPLKAPKDVSGPGSGWECSSHRKGILAKSFVLRYDVVSFAIDRGNVCSVIVTEKRASTLRGVGIGDPLRVAKRAYPWFDCGIPYGYGGVVPACAGRTAWGVNIWFGGHPIDVIEVNAFYSFRDQLRGPPIPGLEAPGSLRDFLMAERRRVIAEAHDSD